MYIRQNIFLYNRWALTKNLGKDNLSDFGIEVAQKPFPYYKISFEQKSFKNFVVLYKNETEITFKKFNQLFSRVARINNQLKFTHFHDPLKPIRLKERRVPHHLLLAVNKKLDRLISEGHNKKLESCDEDSFFSPILITCKKHKSKKLRLDSNFINQQVFRNKSQMPIIHELVGKVAS